MKENGVFEQLYNQEPVQAIGWMQADFDYLSDTSKRQEIPSIFNWDAVDTAGHSLPSRKNAM